MDAVARFLQERTGYCVHFASAFAVMARTLDMPSRIVVGYLPGTRSGSVEQQGQTDYT
ncbi:transglutaminase-like domain-containing protein, partial [Acinetobacter baumannii]